MTVKPKVVALCDEPRVLRAIATQTKNWVDLYDAPDLDAVQRRLENHEDAAILVTHLLLRRGDGIQTLLELRDRFPRNRRCLLAICTDLGRVVDAIHHGLIDTLVHVPLSRGQFLSAVSGPSLSAPAFDSPAATAGNNLMV